MFDDTELERSQSASVIVTNRGTGPGSLEAVRIAGGDAFEAVGLQLLPVEVAAGRDVRFNIVFEPPREGTFAGTAGIDFGFGSRDISFMGRGVAARFTYELINGATTPVADGGTITIPPVTVGEESSVNLRVTNAGTIEGVISRIALQGAGFRLENAPVTPTTVDVGESFTLTISFTPSDFDEATAALQIGDASFTVRGTGGGVMYSTISSSGITELAPRDTIVFPETAIGRTSQVRFSINNTGSEPHNVTLIGASGNFDVAGLPPLPMSLEPGRTLDFDLIFEPAASGILNGSLAIDSLTFSLSGLGGEPTAVPNPTISGAGGAAGAADQLSAGVSIAEPYPVDVTGTLAISFESDAFSNDPSIQFSTGGRTAPFEIPAGQTQARFANNRDTIRFQTGTVTGTIILSSSFQIEETRQDVTPDNAPELTYTLAPQAPRLLAATIGNINQGTVQVLVTGFATTRQVNRLSVSLAGTNLSTTQLEVDAQNAFRAWYQGNQSTGFGSQFTATISLRVDGEIADLTSVSVRASNDLGDSEAVSAELPPL